MIRRMAAASLVVTNLLVQPVLTQPVLAQPAAQHGQRSSTNPLVPIVVGAVAGATFSFLVWPIVQAAAFAAVGTATVGGQAAGMVYGPFMVGGTMMGGAIGYIVSR
jgi:hypothetical protein